MFPRPHLILKLINNKTAYINDGDRVDMECLVSSLSLEAASRQDFVLIGNKGIQMAVNRGGKFSRHLRESDSGSYTCKVTISNITKTSELVHIKVYGE